MTSTTAPTESAVFDTGIAASIGRHWKAWSLASVIAVWVVIWAFTKGTHTLEMSVASTTDTLTWLQARADAIIAANNNAILSLLNSIADGINSIVTFLQHLFTVGKFPRPVPQVGWLGVFAIALWVTYAVAGGRAVPLVAVSFFLFGALGYWEDSIDTLIVTFVAVFFSVGIGIPVGIWMARSKVVTAIITPILDLMQTMPSFVYLLPFVIFFGIGAACATMVTLVYALPPVIRITAYAIRNVSPTTLEATTSLGQTKLQRLRGVELPMAKRTIIVGVNQTMMAALAMVTIAAFVDGPGLGVPVLEGLTRGDLGGAFVSGLCITIMAIMLDRTTTASSVRLENANRSGKPNQRQRRMILGGGGALTIVAIYLSHTRLDYNQWPDSIDIGTAISNKVDDISDWIRSDLATVTEKIQDKFTVWILNPVEDLIANSPWYITFLAIVAIAAIIGGLRAFLFTVACLAGIYYLDLWHDAMVTLTSVLAATVVVMVLAVIVGVWTGRSKAADRLLRPLLDAGQTLPPFVYLVPILILFGPNRFTAICAGVIYAAPAAIKLVADGIRGVSPTTIEAAESAGTSRWQMITKVQLPMSRGSLLLAANQGLLYVLSMIVIGGMVGAGALGFDVVLGFRNADNVGRGIAAGLCLVLLGIMLDRITTYGAQQSRQTNKSVVRKSRALMRRPTGAVIGP